MHSSSWTKILSMSMAKQCTSSSVQTLAASRRRSSSISTDKTLMTNLQKHVCKCWGVEALEAADQMTVKANAKDCVDRYRWTGNLKVAFGVASKKMFCYSTVQHSTTETR